MKLYPNNLKNWNVGCALSGQPKSNSSNYLGIDILARLLLCVLTLGLFLYAYIEKQNAITELRLRLPPLARELQAVEQECVKLQFEIDQFESPSHLLELARRPEYRHLKHPLLKDIVTIEH